MTQVEFPLPNLSLLDRLRVMFGAARMRVVKVSWRDALGWRAAVRALPLAATVVRVDAEITPGAYVPYKFRASVL